MHKQVLWIDDSDEQLAAAERMLAPLAGVRLLRARSSDEAWSVLSSNHVDCVVTDILRRHSNGTVADDDGYYFVKRNLRPKWPRMPVIFHTKNIPGSFEIDSASQYLSKWEPESKKSIELETRISDIVVLYDAFADFSTWTRIEPRLVEVRSAILQSMRNVDEIWRMTPDEFEQLVAELLDKIGFNVLWVPGGKDQGIDIVASSSSADFLIDVKRYSPSNPIGVELVRQVYGVAQAATTSEKAFLGGIITSSRFTKDATEFRNSVRRRPLLRDGEWIQSELAKHAPHLTTR